MINFEDILTLIKAVSDSELVEVRVELDDDNQELTFQASKNKKGEVTGHVAEASVTPQGAFPQTAFSFAPLTSQPVFQQPMPQQAGAAMAIPPAPGLVMPALPPQAAFLGQPDTAAPMNGEYITSPMVGTFYAAPSEDAEPFVAVGDTVKKGQVIGIVEAMKLMNEIESPYDGVVEKIFVENKAMVGFGDELMLIRTGQGGQ